MADKIVYFSVYDPICEVLRGSKYTSREEAERALEWWKTDMPGSEAGEGRADRWKHLELAIVTIERLPQPVHKPEAEAATESEAIEPFQQE